MPEPIRLVTARERRAASLTALTLKSRQHLFREMETRVLAGFPVSATQWSFFFRMLATDYEAMADRLEDIEQVAVDVQARMDYQQSFVEACLAEIVPLKEDVEDE